VEAPDPPGGLSDCRTRVYQLVILTARHTCSPLAANTQRWWVELRLFDAEGPTIMSADRQARRLMTGVMVFKSGSRVYTSRSASGIVAAIEKDDVEYPSKGAPLRDFVSWSLTRLADRIPQRELDASARTDEETLALSYLYLRDEYGIGSLIRDESEKASSMTSTSRADRSSLLPVDLAIHCPNCTQVWLVLGLEPGDSHICKSCGHSFKVSRGTPSEPSLPATTNDELESAL
jgi:hypothetical protein